MNDLEKKIVQWNLKHPLDRSFRQKKNISLFSEEHRKINQLDLLSDYIEEVLYNKIYNTASPEEEAAKEEQEKEIDLFDKIQIP